MGYAWALAMLDRAGDRLACEAIYIHIYGMLHKNVCETDTNSRDTFVKQ